MNGTLCVVLINTISRTLHENTHLFAIQDDTIQKVNAKRAPRNLEEVIFMERVRYDSEVLRNDLSGKLVQFLNAKVLRNGQFVWDHVWVRDGKIVDAANIFYGERRKADIQVDCEGQFLSPGFIDIQIN
ncbi:hypothetical protein GCK32_015847, partial [Trichostrongylus colubriformis]